MPLAVDPVSPVDGFEDGLGEGAVSIARVGPDVPMNTVGGLAYGQDGSHLIVLAHPGTTEVHFPAHAIF